ncbi:rubredoxin [Lentisphaera profundi]|uniref:Rubredoxin n=1 Tax=Lentisphaera profundi TaxID=1658616 RepID=A0ABY7VN49_9BACT|nr:rubredoxin [Lentisphaera profundi]WDE95511.1 rubredoxin [Lentisphaera profundi]
MNMKNLLTINAPGGMLTPNDLLKLVEPEAIDGFILGRRQNILINYPGRPTDLSRRVNIDKVPLTHPNIICSHASGGIDLEKNDWAYINEDYQTIFDAFRFEPTISVSICSFQQSIFPLFSSKLNFISSKIEGLWHLVIMLNQERVLLAHLFKTDQVALAVKTAQDFVDKDQFITSHHLAELIESTLHLSENKSSDLILPPLLNRDFEGFTPMKNGRLALNIFSNHKSWKKEFIQDFAKLAQSQDLNRLYVTAGRSLLMKHISKKDLHTWEALLGRHNISIRHSEQDLAWIVPSHKPHAIKLKEQVIHELNREGFACHGLNIAIDPRDSDCGAPIIIYTSKNFMSLSCKVIYKPNFDYRYSGFKIAGKNLNFDDLIKCLRSLQQEFHTRKINSEGVLIKAISLEDSKPEHYQCPDCLSEYHKTSGDPEKNIMPDTDFSDLPKSWTCPLCECPKTKFLPI